MWVYDIGVNRHLTQSQRENNATEFYDYFSSYGCTIESICGMLGNIQAESDINPGNKETASTSSGWGLIQWTPSTVLTDWCNSKNYYWYDGVVQCYVIECEGEEKQNCGGRFIPTSNYPYTWNEFIALTNVEEATKSYFYERERGDPDSLATRIIYANAWYNYFTGSPPTPPPTPPRPRRKFPIYFMIKQYTH